MEGYARIDTELAASGGHSWMPLAVAMARSHAPLRRLLRYLFLDWRARELAERGVIELSDSAAAAYSSVRFRCTS